MARTPLELRFGQAVRERRLKLNLSQEDLGERAGLHRTYISDVERGARNLSLESIEKIAAGLRISIGSLFSNYVDESQPGIPANSDLMKSAAEASWPSVTISQTETQNFLNG